MDATEMTQDFDSSFKNGKPREAKVMKEITIMEKTFETLNNGDKGSGGVSNQECLLNLTDLNGILEKNDIKQQNGILKAPGVEIAGEHETFHNRGSCSEDHTADKACILQERRLGVLNVAEKTFGKTKVKGCITQAGFSGHLLDSWEKSVCSSPPVASDAKCNQEEVFSVRSISLNGQVADKAAKTTCCSDHLSGNEQREKQLVFTVEDIVKKVSEKESIASEEDFSCSTLDSGGLSESCPSNVNSIKSNVTPYVVLKDINQKRKEKHEYCLIHPNLKQLLQKTQNKRKVGILKKLKVSLYDLLDKSCIKKRRKPPQIQNAEGQLENEKVNKLESGLEFNSSTKVLHSGESVPGETNNGHDIKTERRANSLDISTLCDEGIFARFSFMESYRENSIIHFNEKEIEKRKESLDSVMISETQKLKTTFLEPTEMFMKYECGNKFVKKAEREGSCHKIEEYQDLETLSSRISGGTSTDNTTQKLIANSHTEILQADKIYPSCSSETLSSETKFSKISRNMGAASTLPDTTGNDRDMCQANCEFDSVFVSSLSGDNLKLDLNDAIPSITRNEMFIEKRIVPYSINAFPEEVLREQVDVEKQETINQSNTMSRNKNVDSCWFLLEIEEVINEDVSVCGTDEEKKFKELEYGEVLLNHGICFPQSESKSGCQPFSNDIAVIKPSEIEKRTMAGDHQEVFDGETSNAEESVSPQPAKEKSPVWEEESLQPHQSHGVQIVLYVCSLSSFLPSSLLYGSDLGIGKFGKV
ncbi:uncharacterized protein LOC133370684 [Rhineura floridana]|uniref:uncharacterized protein LOC133370684 n=1 Tax=Rhineura floridana TaxID=261503 RepID=UPI002AC86112|nr:uncharacterized protein LOC133370684 [Rhineura floridana]